MLDQPLTSKITGETILSFSRPMPPQPRLLP